MKRLSLLSVLALGACATANQTYGPSGQRAYVINCSGAALNWGMCQTKAGSLCGTRGYDVVAINGESNPTVLANPYALYAVPIVNRTMEVACKAQR